MTRKFDRFGRRGTVTCRLCGKLTRETGEGEQDLELCKVCIYDSYAENAASDYGENSEEHLAAVEQARQVRATRKESL